MLRISRSVRRRAHEACAGLPEQARLDASGCPLWVLLGRRIGRNSNGAWGLREKTVGEDHLSRVLARRRLWVGTAPRRPQDVGICSRSRISNRCSRMSIPRCWTRLARALSARARKIVLPRGDFNRRDNAEFFERLSTQRDCHRVSSRAYGHATRVKTRNRRTPATSCSAFLTNIRRSAWKRCASGPVNWLTRLRKNCAARKTASTSLFL